jgi:hypothetical protein
MTVLRKACRADLHNLLLAFRQHTPLNICWRENFKVEGVEKNKPHGLYAVDSLRKSYVIRSNETIVIQSLRFRNRATRNGTVLFASLQGGKQKEKMNCLGSSLNYVLYYNTT